MSDGSTRLGAARNATRRAFVAACRQAVDEGEALGDSELVHAAHNALNCIESNTTGPAAGTGAPWTRLCPVSGERIDSGNAFAGSGNDAKAAAMVNGLLRPAGSPIRRRAEAKLDAEWHNPAAAYQVATLCRERGLSTVGNKVRELFLEVQRLEDIHHPKTLPGEPGAGRE